MKIQTIDTYKEKFLQYCKTFYLLDDRNRDWFNPVLSHSIQNSYQKYPYWCFLTADNNDLIAMSCIQTHNYPSNVARVLTRTYYHPKHRRNHLAYEKDGVTPAMIMLNNQLDWLHKNTDIDIFFFSVEYLRRKQSLKNLAKKLNNKYQHNWKVLDNLYQTFPDDTNKFSWQTVCSNTDKLPLKQIIVEEWKQKYE